MVPPLEIFKMDYSGDVRWLEPAKDIEAAKSRLKAQGKASDSLRKASGAILSLLARPVRGYKLIRDETGQR